MDSSVVHILGASGSGTSTLGRAMASSGEVRLAGYR